jgi:hypothetical protein
MAKLRVEIGTRHAKMWYALIYLKRIRVTNECHN